MSLLNLNKLNSSSRKTQAWSEQHLYNFIKASCLLVIVTALGIVGFALIEGWNLADSFYMTIITLSTVGYGEVQPLSHGGRMFAAVLIMAGMVTVAYSVSVIGRSALEGELYRFRKMNKMNNEIKSYRNHYIICGFGRLARFVIPELLERHEKIVLVENNTEVLKEVEGLGIPFVEGNAYEDDVLSAAGIEHAVALLAVLPDDSDNVFVVLSARALNPALKIVARTELTAGEDKLRLAGANHVISPYKVSGARIVQQLTHPFVNDFLEIITAGSGETLALEQIQLPHECNLDGLTLETSELRKLTGTSIAAIVGRDGKVNINPGKNDVLKGGSALIAFGTAEGFEKLNNLIKQGKSDQVN